jgi:hypothetical protein
VNDEQPLRKVPVDLDELCAAFDDASYEHRYFLDTPGLLVTLGGLAFTVWSYSLAATSFRACEKSSSAHRRSARG